MAETASTSRIERYALVLVVALGLGLTFGAAWTADRRAEERASAAMGQRSLVVVEAVKGSLSNTLRDVTALAGLFTASDDVTAMEFNRFITTVGWHPGTIGVAHLPVVARSRLSQYWEGFGPDPWQGPYRLDDAGNRVAVAAGGDPLHPIRYFVSEDATHPSMVGFDAGSDPAWRAAIDDAARQRSVAVSRLGPLDGFTDGFGFVAVAPVTDRLGFVTGFTASVVDVDALFLPELAEAFAGQISWELRDTGAAFDDADDPLVRIESLTVAGRTWQLRVAPTPAARTSLLGNGPLLTFVIGLLATALALVAVHLVQSTHRSRSDARDQRRLSEERNDFLAAISHELRTPLTVVTGLAEVLGEATSDADPEIREYVALLRSEGAELAGLVEDLLLVGRLDAKVLEIRPESIDLRREVERVVAGVATDGRHVAVEGNARAWADPIRFRHVVRQLLTNAVRHGGERISVKVAEEGGRASVAVWDDGQGIPGADVPLFVAMPGHRISAGAPPELGLGLRTAHRLALAMDGDLTHRRLAERTVFTLALPRPPDVRPHIAHVGPDGIGPHRVPSVRSHP